MLAAEGCGEQGSYGVALAADGCGKRRSYIELELQLGEIERVRTLYQKYLQWAPANCGAWCKYAEVEQSLGELARVRAIYELAIEQPLLDMPEVLWKVALHPGSSKPSLSALPSAAAPWAPHSHWVYHHRRKQGRRLGM